MAANAYQNIAYRRLDPAKGEFRLLELRPAVSVDDRVECRMTTARLSDEPDFVALSSLYGDPSESETVIVSGRPVNITKHLAQAIRHVRAVFFPTTAPPPPSETPVPVKSESRAPGWLQHLLKQANSILPSPEMERDAPLRIWLDVLCVNQRDEAEKARQVFEMRKVYSAAQITVGWLGMKMRHSDAGLECMWAMDKAMPRRWGDPGDRDEHPENYAPTHAWFKDLEYMWSPYGPDVVDAPELPPHWAGAIDFMGRPFFQRRWILEEIARAKYPTFLIGDSIVSWRHLLRHYRLLEEFKYSESDVFPAYAKPVVPEMPLEIAHALLDEFAKRSAAEDAAALKESLSSSQSSGSPRSGSRKPRGKTFSPLSSRH